VVSWTEIREDGSCEKGPVYSAVPLRLHPDIRIFSAVPEERSLTAATRVLLPSHVSHEDARFNLSRTALLVVALTQRPDLLLAATEDVLHQPQRAQAMPTSAEYLGILRRFGIASALSGAGPAVIALTTRHELPAEILEFGAVNGFTVREMTVGQGVRWTSDAVVHPR
jgi:homoserine kinase